MDEPANVVDVAYELRQQMLLDAAARWLEELWTVAEKNLNLCIERIWGLQESTLAERIVYYFYIPVVAMISEYVALVLRENWVNVGNHPHKNVVSGSILCRHDIDMSAKCANIWLSGRHVADYPTQVHAHVDCWLLCVDGLLIFCFVCGQYCGFRYGAGGLPK